MRLFWKGWKIGLIFIMVFFWFYLWEIVCDRWFCCSCGIECGIFSMLLCGNCIGWLRSRLWINCMFFVDRNYFREWGWYGCCWEVFLKFEIDVKFWREWCVRVGRVCIFFCDIRSLIWWCCLGVFCWLVFFVGLKFFGIRILNCFFGLLIKYGKDDEECFCFNLDLVLYDFWFLLFW